MRPLGAKPNTAPVTMVSDLLLADGLGWNVAKVNELFFEGDVEDILKIPVGRAGTGDYLAWNYTKNGVFTVKSAYHLKMQLNQACAETPGPSLSSSEHKGWLALWDAVVPGKAKIHVWRLIQNGLAVGHELQWRKIKEGVICLACHREETLKHRF
jgi:hypothetical protein